jgi:hypothetical protein
MWAILVAGFFGAVGISAAQGALGAPSRSALASKGPCFIIGGPFNARPTVRVCNRFVSPSKIAGDRQGNLYVADDGNPGGGIAAHITKLSLSGTPLAKWATEHGVWNPANLTVDPNGHLYILGANLLELSPAGNVVGYADLQPWPKGLRNLRPTDLAVDARGFIYLKGVDTVTWTPYVTRPFVAKLAPLSPGAPGRQKRGTSVLKVLAIWKGFERVMTPPSPPGEPAIAVDRSGSVYVTGFNAVKSGRYIYKLSPTGKVVTSWSDSGFPVDVAVGPHDDLYAVGDREIHEFSSRGAPLTVYGLRIAGGFQSVAVDGQGRVFAIFYTRTGLHGEPRIYEFSTTGKILAGWS